MPLVNCHTHLELSWAGYLCPPAGGMPFSEWIYKLVMTNRDRRETADFEAQTIRAVEAGIEQLLAVGTTHVGDITNSGLSIEPLLDSGLAGVVYIEVLGLVEEVADFMWRRARQMLDTYRRYERNGLRIGLSAHAIYSTLPQTFETVANFCLKEDVPLCIHLSESPFERPFAEQGVGPLYEMPRRFGSEIPPYVPHKSPVKYLEDLGVLEAKPLLVHMVDVTDEELDIVARSGAKVAHCPRSNQLLQCGRMPLEKMLTRGIPVALGTDSLGSSPSLDVREEAETAVSLHADYVPAHIIRKMLENTAVLS
ncbi:MAG: amidohydrolase [Chloroflexi bacterium]|nr:MAG: amidohydrolase [Chloroflexota bacterium]